MKLVIESGSTKADWILTKRDEIVVKFQTSGLNPLHLQRINFEEAIKNVIQSNRYLQGVDEVIFFGAGIIGEVEKKIVRNVFLSMSEKINCEVMSDIEALRKIHDKSEKCIISILGTGTNSALIEHGKIIKHLTPLGFLLGDYGSGTSIGKAVLSGYVRGIFSDEIQKVIEKKTGCKNKEELIRIIYSQNYSPHLVTFIASMSKIILPYKEDKVVKKMLLEVFNLFLKNNLDNYPNAKNIPIHIYGSVAYFFQDILVKVLKDNKHTIGKIERSPINELITYE